MSWSFLILILFSSFFLIAKAKEEAVNEGVDHQNLVSFDYGKFVEKFHKSYSPLETLNKAKLFFGRTLQMFKHNLMFLQKKVNYYLIQNQYTDMTPEELIEANKDIVPEMSPVSEALESPDTPADSLLNVRRFVEETGGHSSCSIEDLKKNPKLDSKTYSVKPVLSFFESQDVPDMRVIVKQLREMPEVREKLEGLGGLKILSSSSDEQERIERAKRRHNIQEKLVVESNNKNYEPQMASSSAANNEKNNDINNYAKYFMNSEQGHINIMHYPTPGPTGNGKTDPEDSDEEAPVNKFMNSLKKVGDFFFTEPGDRDYHMKKTEDEKKESPIEFKNEPPKYDIDWRKSGCISRVGKQDKCNSCYAFATLGLLEYFYCKETQTLTSFSPQYIVDCGSNADLNGCRGGKITNVGQFIRKFGLELDSMYPYLGGENQCPFNNEKEGKEKAGYLKPIITNWQNFQDMTAWYKWIRRSPIIVGINMPLDFFAYGGGVHDGLDCASEMTHAMLLVGSGQQFGKEFWLLKNSYSEEWGEKGYFKLSKSAPLRCFNSAIVARAKFNSSFSKS